MSRVLSPVRRMIPHFIVLLVGFALGNALAGSDMVTFPNITLFDALKSLHDGRKASMIVQATEAKAKTYTVENAATEKMVLSVARQYGKEATCVAGVYVVQDPLPDASSGKARLQALREWLGSQPGGEGLRDISVSYSDGINSFAQGLSKGLPNRINTFGSLTPEQQFAIIDLMRSEPTRQRAFYLLPLMQASRE